MTSPIEAKAIRLEDKRNAAIDKSDAILTLLQMGIDEHELNEGTVLRALWAAIDLLHEVREDDEEFRKELAARGLRSTIRIVSEN
jgi:hypothetical protein